MINIIGNIILSATAFAAQAAGIITSGLKMWLPFEKSEILGEDVIIDGNFPNSNNWTRDSEWAISGNTLNKDGSTDNNTRQLISGSVGKSYQITYTISNYVKGRFQPTFGNTALTARNAEGTYTEVGTFEETTGAYIEYLRLYSAQDSKYSISNVILKEVSQIAPDKSGNSNVATLYTGKALRFDGVNDSVSADGFAGTLSNNTAFTFAVWFNSEKPNTARNFQNILIAAGGTNQATNIFKIGVNPAIVVDPISNKNPGGIYFDDSNGYNNQVPISGGVNYNDGQWHRLVVSRPSGSGVKDLSFYVDGSFIGNADCNPLWNNMSVFDFGQEWDPSGRSDFFKGKMSNVQIYNAEWTQADVTYDYNNPNHLVTDNPSTSTSLSNLKGYWALSEGAGSYAYNSAVALGSEEVDKGDFEGITQAESTTGSDWITGAGWTISGGTANCNNTSGSTQDLETTNRLLNLGGKNLKITFTVSNYSGSASMIVTLQGTGGNDFTGINANGTYSKVVTLGASENSVDLFFKAANGWVGSIDNVSIKEVSVGYILGATWSARQTTIPQLGMMDWSNPTIGSDVVILISDPNDPPKDILGNFVRLREHSLNLDRRGYAKVDPDSSLNITNYSIDGWFYSTNNSSAWEAILTKLTQDNFEVYIRNSQLRYYSSKDSEKLLSAITLNAWTYFCITESSGTLKCYINDDSTPKSTYTITPKFANSGNVYIGSNQSGDYSNALIDDIRVYDRALSADEILNNYTVGLPEHQAGSDFSDDFSSDYGN